MKPRNKARSKRADPSVRDRIVFTGISRRLSCRGYPDHREAARPGIPPSWRATLWRGRESRWMIDRRVGRRDGARPSRESCGKCPLVTPERGRHPTRTLHRLPLLRTSTIRRDVCRGLLTSCDDRSQSDRFCPGRTAARPVSFPHGYAACTQASRSPSCGKERRGVFEPGRGRGESPFPP